MSNKEEKRKLELSRQKIAKQYKDTINQLKLENNQLRKELTDLRDKNLALEDKNRQLEDRIERALNYMDMQPDELEKLINNENAHDEITRAFGHAICIVNKALNVYK